MIAKRVFLLCLLNIDTILDSKRYISYLEEEECVVVVMIMATRQESSEKDMWWVNELEFRGLTVETLNELNNVQETSCLVEKVANIL
jgi:hypothetical protein